MTTHAKIASANMRESSSLSLAKALSKNCTHWPLANGHMKSRVSVHSGIFPLNTNGITNKQICKLKRLPNDIIYKYDGHGRKPGTLRKKFFEIVGNTRISCANCTDGDKIHPACTQNVQANNSKG